MKSISRRSFLGSVAGAAALLPVCSTLSSPGPGKRPNIILLVTDDHRYDAMGCMGNTVIQTPNMDALARHGSLFENNFCTTSICCCSRASIFTGLYTRTHGVVDFGTDLSAENIALSYPAQLRAHGYRTGFVGKHGFGAHPAVDTFDYWRGFTGQGTYEHMVNGQKRHLTDIIRDDAIEFLGESSGDAPFCLSVSFKAPHTLDYQPRPWLPADRFNTLYEDAEMPVPETATEECYDALPEFLKDTEGRKRWENRFSSPERYQETVKDYYRLLTGVDEAIGRIREMLERTGKADNTVIIYTGDNGFFMGEDGLAGKWFAYEESMRTPLIIFDPRVPRRYENRRHEEMALNVDLAPTILDLAGVKVPDAVQGHSLMPIINGERTEWRDACFYEHLFPHPHIPQSEGVRTERWKYVRWVDQEPLYEELFDLHADPTEQNNLVNDSEFTAVLEQMQGRYRSFHEQYPFKDSTGG